MRIPHTIRRKSSEPINQCQPFFNHKKIESCKIKISMTFMTPYRQFTINPKPSPFAYFLVWHYGDFQQFCSPLDGSLGNYCRMMRSNKCPRDYYSEFEPQYTCCTKFLSAQVAFRKSNACQWWEWQEGKIWAVPAFLVTSYQSSNLSSKSCRRDLRTTEYSSRVAKHPFGVAVRIF